MKKVFGAIAVVVGIALVLVGIGALIGNQWAESQVKQQLGQEKIDMPDDKGIAAIEDPACRDELDKYKGQKLETGDQAKAYADCYIWAHMMKASNGKVYQEVSGDARAQQAALTKQHGEDQSKWPAEAQAQAKKAEGLRQSTFMGDSLRGMLLNAYAWWTFAQIAFWVGLLGLIGGLALTVLGFLLMRTPKGQTVAV